MNVKFLLDFISVGFELLIAYLFFRIFLTRWRFSGFSTVILFILSSALKMASSYFFTEAWLKTVFSMLCYYILACCFKGTIMKRITMTGFLGLISIVPEYIVHGFLMLIAGSVYATGAHNLQDYALGMFISKFLVIFICSFLYYWQRCKQEKMLNELNYRWYFSFLIYPAITLVVLIQNYYLILHDEQMVYVRWFVLSSVLLVLSNVVIFLILGEMHRLQMDKLKIELAEQRLAAQEQYYAELTERNKEIKKHIHDTKNLLLVLQSYVMQGNIHDAETHLKEMLDNLDSGTMDYTGNIVLDTVLGAKINEAQKYAVKIVPAIALYGQLNIKVLDLALLLGNALDNAIEATSKINGETKKKIYLTVKLHQDILHIVVKNPVVHPVQIENNSVKTNKENAEMHGFGIPNMQTIVQKYKGTLDLRSVDQIFVLNIVLENEEELR